MSLTGHPWTSGELVVTEAALRALNEDALRGYARRQEACGYLVGPLEDALLCDEAVAMENLADKLHRLDPDQYFRTAESFFAFNEKRFDNAVQRGAAAGRPVKVLYHSHLDVGAYFSATDRAVMSMGVPPAEEGAAAQLGPGPAWPLAFLVASATAAGVDDHKLYVWRDGDFVEGQLTVLAAAGGD